MDSSYIYKLPDKSEPGTNIEAQFINTLEENKKFYTQHQFEQAKRARELFHSLGTPLINDMKALIRMNTIKNNPVTTEDVDIAKKIFGPDISSLKGKTTRRKPVPVIEDYIKIPRELIAAQHSVTLCLDSMKVNGIPFLTTISKNCLGQVF
jgi:hypothetical protein